MVEEFAVEGPGAAASMTQRAHVRVLSDLLCLAAVLLPAVIAAMLVRYVVNVPYWDEWDWTALVYGAHTGSITLAQLWQQHNEHRMFFPNLLMLALSALPGGWIMLRETFAGLAFIVVQQILILRLMRRTLRGIALGAFFLMSSLVLYSLVQSENLIMGFQMAWFLMNGCIIAVVWLLRASPRSVGAFLSAVALGFVAAYSSAQGLLIWPVGLVVLLIRGRVRAGQVAFWLVAAALCTIIYFWGYVAPPPFTAPSPQSADKDAAFYVLAYLGSPLAGWQGTIASAAAGAVLLLGYGAVLVWYFVGRSRCARFSFDLTPWLAIGAYSILGAAMTSAGRLTLGVDQALSSRYTSVSSMLLVALIACAAIFLRTLKRPPTFKIVSATFAAAIFCLLVVRGNVSGFKFIQGKSAESRDALAVALHYKTETDSALLTLYPNVSVAKTYLKELDAIHAGPFSTSQ